jgi:hypothetical protein
MTYSKGAEVDIARWERNFRKLSSRQKGLVPGQESKFASLRRGIEANQRFLTHVALSFQEPSLTEGALRAAKRRLEQGVQTSPADAEKAR